MGGGGVLEPKSPEVCPPKTAQINVSFCKNSFCPAMTSGSEGGGGVSGSNARVLWADYPSDWQWVGGWRGGWRGGWASARPPTHQRPRYRKDPPTPRRAGHPLARGPPPSPHPRHPHLHHRVSAGRVAAAGGVRAVIRVLEGGQEREVGAGRDVGHGDARAALREGDLEGGAVGDAVAVVRVVDGHAHRVLVDLLGVHLQREAGLQPRQPVVRRAAPPSRGSRSLTTGGSETGCLTEDRIGRGVGGWHGRMALEPPPHTHYCETNGQQLSFQVSESSSVGHQTRQSMSDANRRLSAVQGERKRHILHPITTVSSPRQPRRAPHTPTPTEGTLFMAVRRHSSAAHQSREEACHWPIQDPRYMSFKKPMRLLRTCV